ncbi:MAG: aspartoacylase [Cyanobacteriota bacterium]|nr:aspartoacylase [Cyanobacteriota bacterium]
MPITAHPGGSILVVAGTHGNECNAPWLQQQWRANPASLIDQGFALELVLGNPAAAQHGRRYLERDLNRCFARDLLDDPAQQSLEVVRARELLAQVGPAGVKPTTVVFDLHSTTASMGNSLVVYGRRPADLALAAGMQQRLGLPIYLHEGDAAQTGFLIERWPCGLVIEVGPVPQGVLQQAICLQTQLALEAGLAVLADAASGSLRLPQQLVVHRHLGSVDLPRRADGTPAALVHSRLQGRDWCPLAPSDPVLWEIGGCAVTLAEVMPAALAGSERYWPVFVNEAAYREKGIAFSLTSREIWPLPSAAPAALQQLASGLQRR